jgi:hypothetical protein
MKKMQTNSLPEPDKLGLIGYKMRQIASSRKENSWSKLHFFAKKGRHQGAQDLYDLLSSKDFSLHNATDTQRLLDLLEDPNRQFTHTMA